MFELNNSTTLRELYEALLTEFKGKKTSWSFSYQWSAQGKPLEKFKEILEQPLKERYPMFSIHVNECRNTIAVMLYAGRWQEQTEILSFTAKRSKENNDFFLKDILISGMSLNSTMEEVIAKVVESAEKFYEKDTEEANSVISKMLSAGLSTKSLESLYNEYRNLTPQGKDILRNRVG